MFTQNTQVHDLFICFYTLVQNKGEIASIAMKNAVYMDLIC